MWTGRVGVRLGTGGGRPESGEEEEARYTRGGEGGQELGEARTRGGKARYWGYRTETGWGGGWNWGRETRVGSRYRGKPWNWRGVRRGKETRGEAGGLTPSIPPHCLLMVDVFSPRVSQVHNIQAFRSQNNTLTN